MRIRHEMEMPMSRLQNAGSSALSHDGVRRSVTWWTSQCSFPLSAVIVSVRYLPRCIVTCGKKVTTAISSEPLTIRCHVIVTHYQWSRAYARGGFGVKTFPL